MRRYLVIAVATWLWSPATAAAVSCTNITYGTLALGTYTGVTSTSGNSSGTINCPAGFNYRIGVSQGLGSGATTATRKLTGPSAATLNYQLFQNSARTTNWGNVSGTDTLAKTGTGSGAAFIIYPSIPAGQYPVPGSYTDTVTVTLYNTSPLNSGSVSVTATVQPACTISASPLAFGTYTGAEANAIASLTVTCTNTTPYYVNLGDGQNYDGSFYPRMAGPGGSLVSYRLYQNAGYTVEWRNTYNVDGRSGTGSGAAQPLTVYGRVFSGQYGTPGAYTDTIIATLVY